MLLLALLVLVLLALAGAIAVVQRASRTSSASREPRPEPVPLGAPPTPKLPPEWGWARLHLEDGRRALGFYYRDRSAGPSFHVLVEGAADERAAIAASEGRFRGNVTHRLGAHETMSVEGLPPDAAAFMRGLFEGSTGPARTRVLRLTASERSELGLPEAPPWIHVYLD